jgi:hypothetical protein
MHYSRPAQVLLRGLAGSANDVWAVGSTESNNTPTIPFAVHGS